MSDTYVLTTPFTSPDGQTLTELTFRNPEIKTVELALSGKTERSEREMAMVAAEFGLPYLSIEDLPASDFFGAGQMATELLGRHREAVDMTTQTLTLETPITSDGGASIESIQLTEPKAGAFLRDMLDNEQDSETTKEIKLVARCFKLSHDEARRLRLIDFTRALRRSEPVFSFGAPNQNAKRAAPSSDAAASNSSSDSTSESEGEVGNVEKAATRSRR